MQTLTECMRRPHVCMRWLNSCVDWIYMQTECMRWLKAFVEWMHWPHACVEPMHWSHVCTNWMHWSHVCTNWMHWSLACTNDIRCTCSVGFCTEYRTRKLTRNNLRRPTKKIHSTSKIVIENPVAKLIFRQPWIIVKIITTWNSTARINKYDFILYRNGITQLDIQIYCDEMHQDKTYNNTDKVLQIIINIYIYIYIIIYQTKGINVQSKIQILKAQHMRRQSCTLIVYHVICTALQMALIIT